MRSRARQDPPEFSFSQSQLSILAKRQISKQREPGAFILTHQSTGKPQVPRDPSVVDERLSRTPLRTPNPIARSDISGTKVTSHQQQLLHSVLQKASSTLSDTNGASDDIAAGKRTLKKVLAQQLLRKKQHVPQPSPKHQICTNGSPTESSSSSNRSPGIAAITGRSKLTYKAVKESPRNRRGGGASDGHKASAYSLRERLLRARTPTKVSADRLPPVTGETPTVASVGASHTAESVPPQMEKVAQAHRELKLKDHVKLARSLDDEETRDRVQQIVSKHFAQKNRQQSAAIALPRCGDLEIEDNTKKSEDYDPEGYSDFFRVLQDEVSVQHVQVNTNAACVRYNCGSCFLQWCSFVSVVDQLPSCV